MDFEQLARCQVNASSNTTHACFVLLYIFIQRIYIDLNKSYKSAEKGRGYINST